MKSVSRLSFKAIALALAMLGSTLVHPGSASAQTAGTTLAPLNCPNATAVKNCNAQDVNTVSYKLVTELDPCTGPTDSGQAQIDITYKANTQRYDITSITSIVGESVAGGSTCAETYLGTQAAGTYTQRATLTYKCVDSNNNGTIDISSVFNWNQKSGDYTAPVVPTGTPVLNTPKCFFPGYVDIQGLAFVNPPGADFRPAGSTTDAQASESGDTGSFPMVLTSKPSADVVVTFGSDGQCTFDPSPVTFTAANWDKAQTITATPIDDPDVEGAHSCTPVVTFASADAGYDGLSVTAPAISVADNDGAGLAFTPSADDQVSEAGDTGYFPLSLTSAPTGDVTITITGDGQCSFDPSPVTFTAANWNTPQQVTVTAIDDASVEGDHTCTPTFSVASTDANYDNLSSIAPVTYITDNDTAAVSFADPNDANAADGSATEGGDTGSFPLVLTSKPTADVVITLTGDGQCTFDPSPVTFTAANWDQVQTITVTPVDDSDVEGEHSCTPTVSISSTDTNYSSLTPTAPDTTVIDNDTAAVSFADPNDANAADGSATEGGDTGSFPLVLTSKPTADVVITLTGDGQCSFDPSPVTFTAANWDQVQTITVTPVDDSDVEGEHSCTPTVSISSTDTNYSSLTPTAPDTTVLDNDTAAVSFADPNDANAADGSATEGGDTGSFPLVLTSKPAADVVITLTGDGQCTFDPSPVTFTAANWDQVQTITVTPVDDSSVEGEHSCTPTVSISSTDTNYSSLAPTAPDTTVIDNDTASVSFADPNDANAADGSATEGDDTGSFPLVLTSKPTADVVITLTGDGQCTFDPSPVTFTAANWDQVQTITVTPVDDSDVEGEHSCTPTVSISSTDTNYSSLTPTAPDTTVIDNDTASVSFADPNDANAADGSATEGGDTGSFPLVLTSKPAADVVITLTGDGQCTFDPSPATFTAANWDQVQTITVTPVDDSSVEGEHSCTPTVSISSTDTNYSSLTPTAPDTTVLDNDTASVSFADPSDANAADGSATEGGDTGSFPMVLTSKPAADVVITLTGDGQCTFDPSPVTFTAANWDQVQTITVTPVNDSSVEGEHNCTPTVSISSADPGYGGLAVEAPSTDIADNDAAGILFSDPAHAGVADGDAGEAGDTGSFPLVLTSKPAADVVITLASDGQCSFDPSPVTFTAANWDKVQTITVTPVDDAAVEGDHSCTPKVSVSSTDANYGGLTPAAPATAVADNDTAGDLRVTLAGPSPSLEVDQDSVYTATVTNHATTESATATVQIVLPPGLAYVSAKGDDWQCTVQSQPDGSQLVTCSYAGVLEGNGGSRSVDITVRPSSSMAGEMANVYASVDPTGGSNPPAPGPQCLETAGSGACAASSAKVGNIKGEVSNDTLHFMQVHADRILNALSSGGSRLQQWQNTACYSSVADMLDVNGDATEQGGNMQGSLDVSTKGLCRGDRRWNAWAQGDLEYLFGDDGAGKFGMGTIGLEYLLNEHLLVGVRASGDYLEADLLEGKNGEVSGNGWLVGPYLSAEPVENVFFQVTALYGKGYNDLDGTYGGQHVTGDFTTSRFFGEASLAGEIKMEKMTVTPSAALSVGREWHDGFDARLKGGRVIGIDDQDYLVARVTARSEFAMPLLVTEEELVTVSLTPNLSWDFLQSGDEMTGGQDDPEAVRAGVDAALLYSTGERTNVKLEVGYDGILNPDWSGLSAAIELGYKW